MNDKDLYVDWSKAPELLDRIKEGGGEWIYD